MAGESPLDMMRAPPRRLPRAPARPRRRMRRIFAVVAVFIILALGWSWLWFYAASIADRALSGWIAREAQLGRVYACAGQSISGFPFGIVTTCDGAAAAFRSNQPPFDVRAGGVTFSAALFRPTLLNGDITGPVTLADPGQSPIFSANWTQARIILLGLPPEPERIAVTLQQPRLDRIAGDAPGMIFQADSVDVDGRIIQGTARSHPVIEATGRFAAATAPTFHPLLAAPLAVDIDAVLRGFNDFAPKPWTQLFQEMQAAHGGIEIKALRLERSDAAVVGTGTLTLNDHGRLDGVLQVTVAGLDNIVPLLGIDQLIGQGVNRLTGGSGSPAQGLDTLDRLVPGLGGVVRQSASASVIDSIKSMGQPTELDKKPAVALPLRIDDGVIYLGLIPLGTVPALF
jgi:hypothetical protein